MHFFIFLKLILHHIHNFNLSVGLVGILKPVKYSVGIFNRQDHISKVSTLWVSHSITHMASLASHSAKHTTFSLGQKGARPFYMRSFYMLYVIQVGWKYFPFIEVCLSVSSSTILTLKPLWYYLAITFPQLLFQHSHLIYSTMHAVILLVLKEPTNQNDQAKIRLAQWSLFLWNWKTRTILWKTYL